MTRTLTPLEEALSEIQELRHTCTRLLLWGELSTRDREVVRHRRDTYALCADIIIRHIIRHMGETEGP